VSAGSMGASDEVVAVLTGNVLKDPTYTYEYHTRKLLSRDNTPIESNLANEPVLVPYDLSRITTLLDT